MSCSSTVFIQFSINASYISDLYLEGDIIRTLSTAFGNFLTYASEYQVPCFTDYKEMAEKIQTDAVILNLPHWLHCEAVVFFLEHGLHVLVEKPMANTVAECDKMINASVKSQKKLAVGHVQRFFLANRRVKEIVQSGELGRLCMFEEHRSINYFAPERPAWFLDKNKAGGGIVMNYGAHALDTLYYIVGEEACEICSSYGNLKNNEEIEGHMQFFLKFPSGLSMSETLDGYQYCGHDMVYYFTEAVLKVDNGATIFKQNGDEWEEICIEKGRNIMDRQLIDFCNYLEGKPSIICTAEEGRKVIATLNKIYQRG